LLPTRVVFTYGYVNPVIATLLAWLLLDERITGWTLAGAAMVLLGVAGVFRAGPRR
jgi:drug/metabolite transporter (DMT)-like permease